MEQKTLPPPQEKSVFEQVKKQRTPAKRMEAIDIITKSAEETGADPQRAYASLVEAVRTNPKVRVMRANNTLFTYFNLGNGQAEIAMDTADSPRELVESIKQFLQAMKVAGFKTGQFGVDNPQILKAIEMAGGKVSTQSTNQLLPDGKTPALIGMVEF